MKSPEEIEKMLEHFGAAWPDDSSILDRVMGQLRPIPARPAMFKTRRIIVKSLLATAASIAVCLVVWWASEGSQNSLYAQVIDAARKARTIHIIHYGLLGKEAKPIKLTETWYEKNVGFRRDVCNSKDSGDRCATICLGSGDDLWTVDKEKKNTIIHSRSGIIKETDQIFSDFTRSAQGLKGKVERYAEGDQTFDDRPCKAYLSKAWSRTDKQRELFYLDPQFRIVRVERQERDDDRWKTTSLSTVAYDESFEPALFQPDFGKDFRIVDANASFGTPETKKPEGPSLIYEVEPKSESVNIADIDMDRIVKALDMRLNSGAERLANLRRLADRRIEVTLMHRDKANRQRVERQLARPGTLEFRILANKQIDDTLIARAEKEPARTNVLGPSGKRLGWWVPVKASEKGSVAYWSDDITRTTKVGHREMVEVLVTADPYNITGAYLSQAKLQFDALGRPNVGFTLNDAGGRLFAGLTSEHLPKDSLSYRLGIVIDGELFSAPSVRSKIGKEGEITGSFTEIEASDLAAVLNAGSLPVRLRLVGNAHIPSD